MTDFDTTNFASLEKSGWSDPGTAASYADGFAQAAGQCVPGLVAAVEAGPGNVVLDLCCGHGNVTRGLLEAGADVTALDFSPAMLAMASRNAPGARFVEGDAMNLPFGEAEFDAITVGFGILHVPDAARVFAEARRVLRPGGKLAYSIWHDPTIPTALDYVFTAVAEHGDPSVTLPPGPGLHDYANPVIAHPELERAGFGNFGRRVVDSFWIADQPDLPYHNFKDGTVRGGVLLQGQPPEAAERIRAAVADKVVAAHGDDGPWRLPLPAVIMSAEAI